MSSQADVVEVAKNKAKKKSRFDQRDWTYIADHVCETFEKRKKSREDLEKIWKEVDRQVAMIPEISHKTNADGSLDKAKAWMPEVELPLQAQTLEVLTADARRMLSPDSGSWNTPHAALTDKYLERVDFSSLVTGDENDVPSLITQDNADKLVQGVGSHWRRQYDFWGNVDKINAESFKYSMGVGRVRLVNKRSFMTEAKGVITEDKKIPVLVPISIKNTYLDDSKSSLMNEGHMVGKSTIFYKKQKLTDVVMAASGSSDPENMDGGWMAKNLANVKADKNGDVEILELEGDIIVPRKTTDSMYIPNCIVTVVRGTKDNSDIKKVIRFRFNKLPFHSYIEFPYHYENIDSSYPTSPLIKGWPIAKAAAQALCRLMESAALKIAPPIGYDKDDTTFASNGGLSVHPYAQWATIGDVNVYGEIGGDPAVMQSIYFGFLQQYADVTGVNAPRLGAQTNSHTTAYAKEAELSRGTIRTVDYVRTTLSGALAKFLYMEYAIGRETVKNDTIYIDAYNGFVTISKEHLPDECAFEAHGSGGNAEEQAKRQDKLSSLQFALQLDTANVQLGGKPVLNIPGAIEQTLREGKWTDIDILINQEEPGGDAQDIAGLTGAQFAEPSLLG